MIRMNIQIYLYKKDDTNIRHTLVWEASRLPGNFPDNLEQIYHNYHQWMDRTLTSKSATNSAAQPSKMSATIIM